MTQTTSGRSELAASVATGFSLLTLQAIAGRVAALLGQIVLAIYLGPEDFGLMALALTVQSFALVLQQSGLREVLVQRPKTYHRWLNTAFWLSMSIGIAAGAVTYFGAPAIARMYGSESAARNVIDRHWLVPMLHIMALAMPISAAATVALAKLQTSLRFKELTLISLVQSVGTVSLSCVFAALGFGVMSFVYPWPIVAVITTGLAWRMALPRISKRPSLRRWRMVLSRSTPLLLAAIFFQSTLQGGAIVLGLFHADNATIGVFAFSFTFALQTTQLLTYNLGNVLFPALARIDSEQHRQRTAFFTAARLLAYIGTPICVLQAVVSPALLQTLFHGRWSAASVPMQVLSLAMAVQLANGPSLQLLLAQKRNVQVLGLSFLFSSLFIVSVTIGASFGGAVAISLAVAIYNVIVGHACMAVASAATGERIAVGLGTYLKPVLLSAIAALTALGSWKMAQPVVSGDVAQLVVQIFTFALSYLLLLRYGASETFHRLTSILGGVLGALVRRSPATGMK